ncbi:Galactose oxidase/kelch beta-propeller [Arabidopsis suecica]|uniref:Galactose oxidase/kelch beta-propeller n=1 Tax=Arabidopsis suecica TaxID=45249 RepID=A0A8T2AGU5_ARASU|nr:Galactose oxidase/kelch beta-propeller [Arabidopsis suecica]
MSELPGDLVEEILCRVPTTSLNRLRYTCKRWNRLFNQRRFTRKHLDKAAKQFLVLMLKQRRVCLMSVNLYGIPSLEVKGELSLIDPHSSVDQFMIFHVSHCDGLLLCNNVKKDRIVVWNPCTGETRWIQPRKIGYYVLGSYQDKKYDNTSYKILCCCDCDYNEFEIYEINSNSWRTLDFTLECDMDCNEWSMSLRGKSYCFASDEKEEHLGIFLVSFDYTTERFERLPLPYKCSFYEATSLSVVRDEKLSVLLELENTSRTEIWVTNKIDHETKVVSWSKVLTVDLKPELYNCYGVSFLVDVEKKILMCCDINFSEEFNCKHMDMVYIVGEDNKVEKVNFGLPLSLPCLFNYVPSMTQIQQG